MPAKIAIFIDAENVDPSFSTQIFGYARSLGEVTVREIYGSGISLNEWGDSILENTIHTNFTLRPNRYKNSSDIALTIGAMETLFSSRGSNDSDEKPTVDAIIIVSSDSDFSPLAFHLRANGIDVIAMGEPGRVNPMWPKACTEFVELSSNAPLVRKRDSSAYPPPLTPSDRESAESFDIPTSPIKPVPAITPESETIPQSNESDALSPSEKDSFVDEKKKRTVKIASTHHARVEIIRVFISKQLTEHDGRMKSGALFKALNTLPDYSFDQQRSKRKPLDYLAKQYGEWFKLEPGEKGSFWVTFRDLPINPPIVPNYSDAPVSQQEDVPDFNAEGAASSDAQREMTESEKMLQDIGIPLCHIDRVSSILPECKNLRDIYNHLRQAFGNSDGRKYYEMMKACADPGSLNLPFTLKTSAAKNVFIPQASGQNPEQIIAINPNDAVSVFRLTPQEQFLVDQGLKPAVAVQVQSIISSSENLRIAYNELRKAFGKEGRTYLSLVKSYAGQSPQLQASLNENK